MRFRTPDCGSARRSFGRHARRVLAVSATIAVVATAVAPAAAIERQAFLTDLDFPTNVAFAPDGRMFFTEKNTGNVRIVTADGELRNEPFVRFPVANAGETGMLGIALDPAFERRPWVYLYLSDASSGRNVLVRVRDDGGVAGARQTLGTFLPWSVGYHNGGELLFGPDGMLYVAVGEGHDPARAQDPSDPGGAILRLEPDGSLPEDNPFDGSPVFTTGHRNSFGLCADPETGDLWQTENGPDVDDEVNLLEAGENYGWPEVTGDSDGRFADPVVVFPTPEALTGCAVWRGELWFGAANTGAVYRMPIDRSGASPERFDTFGAPVIDVSVGLDDVLHVVTSEAIWRLTDDEVPPDDATVEPTPTGVPTPSPTDTVVMPRGEDDGNGGLPPIVPILAAIVLAIALVVRFRAGRALRRAS